MRVIYEKEPKHPGQRLFATDHPAVLDAVGREDPLVLAAMGRWVVAVDAGDRGRQAQIEAEILAFCATN